MSKARPPVGILAIGTEIPETYHSAERIAAESGLPIEVVSEKLGLRRKRVPGAGDGTIAMGVRAARKALQAANVSPNEVDLVIWAGEEYRERPIQTACIKVQKELSIRRGWGFDMSLRCGTVIAAMKIAKDLLTADDSLRTVLVVSGYRNSDLVNYRNPRTRFLYGLAAGGAAVILRKGHAKNCVLDAAIRTDGSFSDDVYVPAGGTEEPLTPEALAAGRQFLDVIDPEGMKERLDRLSMENFVGVVRDSLARSGHAPSDVAYLAVLHMKRSAHVFVLDSLGIPPERSTYLEDFGHMGQNDPIVSLEIGLSQGKLHDGDVVVLVAAGIGYVWDALTLRWGA